MEEVLRRFFDSDSALKSTLSAVMCPQGLAASSRSRTKILANSSAAFASMPLFPTLTTIRATMPLLARNVDWALSPAYDLTPSPVVTLDHRDLALVCGDQGRFANAKNILSQHARFLLPRDEAEKIIADICKQVERCVSPLLPATREKFRLSRLCLGSHEFFHLRRFFGRLKRCP